MVKLEIAAAMTPPHLPRRAVSSFLLPVLATLIVAGSLFYSGVYAKSGAKDIDTRWFYIAAKCWGSGLSPYEASNYAVMFQAQFGVQPDNVLPYPPMLLPIVLPMAPFSWPVAAKVFSLLNFGAALVLFWACYRLVREELGEPLGPLQWFWVVLASTLGGAAGTILTGQTSVFIAAACAIALVGCRLRMSWLTVIGLVLASAKPQASGPLLLFIPLFEPLQRKATLIAIGIIAVLVAYAAKVDANLVHSFLGGVHHYAAVPVNNPATQVGLVALLLRAGIRSPFAQMIGAVSLVAVLGLTAWVLKRSHRTLSRNGLAMMLLIFSVGLTLPLHGYDLCCYALGLALLGVRRWLYQALLLVPALFLWRPALLLGRDHLVEIANFVATLAWLALLLGIVAMTAALLRERRSLSADVTV